MELFLEVWYYLRALQQLPMLCSPSETRTRCPKVRFYCPTLLGLTELIKAFERPVGWEDATVVDLLCQCKR